MVKYPKLEQGHYSIHSLTSTANTLDAPRYTAGKFFWVSIKIWLYHTTMNVLEMEPEDLCTCIVIAMGKADTINPAILSLAPAGCCSFKKSFSAGFLRQALIDPHAHFNLIRVCPVDLCWVSNQDLSTLKVEWKSG